MRRHTLPLSAVDRLARDDDRRGDGGDTGDVLGQLRAGQRSKRWLLLHELRRDLCARTPELARESRVEEAFALLAALQRQARSPVDEVLLQPMVGAWATDCLRRLANGERLPPASAGHLGAIAAAAALRAGLAFEVTAYARDGEVVVPTLGAARVGGGDGWCRLRSRPGAGGAEVARDGTTVHVPLTSPAADDRWRPLRRLRSSAGGMTIDVQLDDLDPFRSCGQLPVAGRLGATEVATWQAALDQAWALLVDDHPHRAAAIATGVGTIVPLRPTAAAAELSATCREAGGAVAMTPPGRPLTMALALVHEFQHTKLWALLDLVPLDRARPGAHRLYAPWRDDPRPVRGLLHGTYAFLGLTGFWGVHRRRGDGETGGGSGAGDGAGQALAHFEHALGRIQVGRGLAALRASGQLRPLGARFVEGMGHRLAEVDRQLDRQPVPRELQALARLAAADHATSWRLRNLRPDPGAVSAGADAWLAGRPCPWSSPPSTTPVDGGGPSPSAARLALLRRRLAFPTRWRDEIPGDTSPADLLLLGGEPGATAMAAPRAGTAYAGQVAADPDDLASWAGLALSRRRRGDPAGWALSTMPETVYAVHHALRERTGRAPDVGDLATWAGGAATTGPPLRPTGSTG